MHPCYRTIDRPQIMFGLEAEDIAMIALGIGAGSLIVGPMIPGIIGIGCWVMLMKYKNGKPAGYIMHLCYQHGFDLPGHVPSPKKYQQYGAYASNPIKKHALR